MFRLLQVASLSRVRTSNSPSTRSALRTHGFDVHLDLVGEDTLGGQLQESTRELALADRVTFHGFLPQDELPRLFASADLYVQTSLHEAAGVSVLEAAASGVPVIGTRAGYVSDWTPDRAAAIDDPSAGTFAREIEHYWPMRSPAQAGLGGAGLDAETTRIANASSSNGSIASAP